MSNERIKGLSINNLKKKIGRTADPQERGELENLLIVRKQEQSKWAEKVINSKIYNLATAWLRIQGKAVESRLYSGTKCYDYNTAEIFLAMAEIVHTAEKKGIKI